MEKKTARQPSIRPEPPMLDALPPFFQELASLGCLTGNDMHCTADGFYSAAKSIADILIGKGITTFPNFQDQERDCDKFFDDWYLYAVPGGCGYVYSLFKMREQEHNAENGEIADGDTPGVTVSFIEFQTACLKVCLVSPTFANRKALNREIDRVVAARGQTHHKALKAYFNRPEAEGPYLIAELYVRFLASLAREGYLAVPKDYAALYRKAGFSGKGGRLPRFLASNNEAAGYPVCDHEKIYIRDPEELSPYEKCALLATHTADVSFHSFAAEVRYHARFLVWYAKIPLPLVGRSVYDSAIRADMTIAETELEGPAPFHRLNSKWVRQQQKFHPEYSFFCDSETCQRKTGVK